MKKQLANILSISRIIGGIILYFFNSFSTGFLSIYSYCALSDLIDGPVARKTHSESATGAALDTVGDVVTYIAMAKVMLIQGLVPWWIVTWFAGAGAGILSSAAVAKAKHGRYMICHSLFGKIMGVVVFLVPFATLVIETIYYLILCCFIATITAIESILIQVYNEKGEEDPVTLYKVLKDNKENN